MYTFIERFCQIFGLSILVLLFAACGGGGGGFSGDDQKQNPTTPAEPLSITTSSLQDGTVGQAYLQLLEVQGGSSNTVVQWVSQGQLPPGLTLDPSLGKISGTPTNPGIYPFVVQAQDAQNSSLNSDPKQFSITIAAPPSETLTPLSITTKSPLPDGTVNQSYLTLLTGQGGGSKSDFRWSVTSGNFPSGFQLTKVSTTQSKIQGTPSQGGTFTFLIKLEDIANPALTPAIQQFSITIQGGSTSGATPAAMSLSTNSVSVPSNNSVGATITATVLDANKSIIPGANVKFSTDGGQLNPGSAVTDKDGNAVTEFKAGGTNANQIATVVATTGTLSKQIPIRIVGTTLQLTPSTTSLPDDGSQSADIQIQLLNSGNVGIFDSPVCLQQQSTDGGKLIFLNTSGNLLNTPCPISGFTGVLVGNTDGAGQLAISIQGSNAGKITLKAISAGAQASKDFSITNISKLFQIIAPSSSAPPQIINKGEFAFTVKAPGTTKVVLSTSLGAWQIEDKPIICKNGQVVANGQAAIEVDVVGNEATAKLQSCIAGTASVVASDKNDQARTDNLQVQFTANIKDAAKLSLDASARVVPVSIGGVQNTSTLIAKLLTDKDEPVANAVVNFTQLNSTGGGETIFPPTAVTDAKGVARVTFTSGSAATSGNGIELQAKVVKPNGTELVNSPPYYIVITYQAGSVTIGSSTKVESINQDTAYRLPMSVLVADVNGNPAKNAVVNLSAWPLDYWTGFWIPKAQFVTDGFSNEDINENLRCDGCSPTGSGEDINGDGIATPVNSTAGDLPLSVTTDEKGLATFDLVYLKANAGWITDRIRASTQVSGTQITSEIVLPLSPSAADVDQSPPILPSSPFNSTCPYKACIDPDLNICNPPTDFVVPQGGTNSLTPYLFPLSPQADVASRPVKVLVDGYATGTAIRASGGFTNDSGQFLSTVAASNKATVGDTAKIDYYISCALVSINARVIAPLTTGIINPPGDTVINAGTNLSFVGNVQGGVPPYEFTWAFPGGTPPTGSTLSPGAVLFNTAGVYTVTFTVTDSTGKTDSSIIYVTVNP